MFSIHHPPAAAIPPPESECDRPRLQECPNDPVGRPGSNDGLSDFGARRSSAAVEHAQPSPKRPRSAVLIAGLVVLNLFLFLLGCATDHPSSSGSSGITQLHLFSAPVAITLGMGAGPDAVAVKIFACEGTDAKGVAITKGQLDFLMFDGLLVTSNTDKLIPLKTWTFLPKDLRRFEFKRVAGVGYDLALGWEQSKPKAVRVTVVARYRFPDAQVVYSEPAVISTAAR